MLKSIERGISLYDWEILTVGMILDYIYTFNDYYSNNNENEEKKIREATQADFDSF